MSKTQIYYDCEMIERGRDLPIQLVSIGMVRDDGRDLYLINEECLSNVNRHPWASLNLAPNLPIRSDGPYIFEWDREQSDYASVVALDLLADYVLEFITEVSNVELWAYYGAYDHVALCQLFGSMGELPAGVPMMTHDIQQLREEHRDVVLPPQPEIAHHALLDARWVQESYHRLKTFRPSGDVTPYSPRNVALIGHPDAGATTLAQAMETVAPPPRKAIGGDPNVIEVWTGEY